MAAGAPLQLEPADQTLLLLEATQAVDELDDETRRVAHVLGADTWTGTGRQLADAAAAITQETT